MSKYHVTKFIAQIKSLRKPIVFFLHLLLLFTSCKKNSNETLVYKDELQDNVVLIREETKNKIIQLNGNTLIVKGTTGYTRDIQSTQDFLKIGTILVCEPIPNVAPEGIFNTVVDIQPNTDPQYGPGYNNITLAPASIEEYIKNTEGYNTDIQPFISEQIQPVSGVTYSVGGNSIELVINKQITQNLGSQASVNFKVTGNLKFEKDIRLGLNIRNSKIENFKLEILNKDVANIKVEGNLELASQKEWDLCKIKGSPIKFSIGTIPVWVTPVFTVKFKLEANGKAGFNIDIIKFDRTYSNGIEFSNNSWKEIAVESPTTFTPLQIQLFLEGEAKINLEASLEGKFYNGLVSIGINGGLFRKLKNRIQSGEPTKCDWIFGAEAGLSIKSSIFSKELLDFNYTVFQWEFKREIIDLLAAPPFDPINGLVAYYPFNGNTLDQSNMGNNGTLTGSASLSNDRKSNNNSNSLSVGGFNSMGYLSIFSSPSLQFQNNNGCTFSFWVKLNNWGVQWQALFGKGGDGGSAGPGLYSVVQGGNNNSTTLAAAISGNGGTLLNPILNYSILNQWHHIVVQYKTGSQKMFVDAIEVATNNGVLDFTNSNDANLFFGAYNSGWYSLDGYFDDIRIYNRILSNTEITSLYNE